MRCRARGCWRIWLALTRVLQMGRATGDGLRVLSGHLCHFGLAVLEEICPWSLASEVRAASGLIMMTRVNLWRDHGGERCTALPRPCRAMLCTSPWPRRGRLASSAAGKNGGDSRGSAARGGGKPRYPTSRGLVASCVFVHRRSFRWKVG